MEFSTFARGVVIGLSIAAPVGPIGLLVIRKSLAEGGLTGFVTGLGAAAADALYGVLAGLGVGALVASSLGDGPGLKVVGGLALVALGVKGLLDASEPVERDAPPSAAGLARAFLTTLGLTLANPMTILTFAALVASAGVAPAGSGAVAVFVVAVFVGSALWWLALSSAAAAFGSRIGPRAMRWVNRASGAIIAAFGVGALVAGTLAWVRA